MTNGNGWVKWLVATLWGALVMVILFMGNVVRGNDLDNRKDHIRIIDKAVALNNDTVIEVEKVKDIVTDIRIEQMEQKTMLRSLLNK